MLNPDFSPLVITEVRITPQRDRALRAFVSITLNGCFVIRGLKIIEGQDARFVAMPSRKRADSTHQDVAHPITKEWRDYMEAVVFEAFDRAEGTDEGDLHSWG
jgi:stage V sporulation protein G